MRKNSWMQKLLYGLMVILGAYILYKSGALLAARRQMQKTLNTGSVQRSMEDSAMRTWSLGYTTAVEGKKLADWISMWFQQVVPVLSYVADGENVENKSEENESKSKDIDESVKAERESEWEDTSTAEEARKDNSAENVSQESESAVESQKQWEEATESQTQWEEEATESQTQWEQETTESQVQWEEQERLTESLTQWEGEQERETESQELSEKEQERETESQTQWDSEQETNYNPAQEVSVGTLFSQVLPQLGDFSYLLSNYYTVDSDTMADAELLNAAELLSWNLSIEQDASVPQILIYHTHSQEAFADSVEGEVSDTVVGMGEILAEELRSYGYNVVHDTGVYDLVDGVLDRSAAYDYARESVQAILEEYPTIEVIIDLHRDGVDGNEEDFVTEIDGKRTARIMFFNGLSRNESGEALSWLPNAYLTENLAFSLQLQVLANAQYPGFTRKIYLQAERYNLHLRARSLLIEAGTQLNTVEEERNAMAPIANLIRQVLGG